MSKQKISQSKKNEVWLQFYTTATGQCWCCHGAISRTSYSCGHVLAESRGGTLDRGNLRPLCVSCNSSMRAVHMFDFMYANRQRPPVADDYFDRWTSRLKWYARAAKLGQEPMDLEI